jgi:hypothetical protein
MRTSPQVRSSAKSDPKKSKYEKWYEELCYRARGQVLPSTAYTEIHHIRPRSLGGSDDSSNLVRLTYKQHFTAHRLLTKIHTGRDLQKMQRALWAMTLKASGERTTKSWQFEAAKRAVRDMELEDDDAAYLARWQEKRLKEMEAASAANLKSQREFNAREFLNNLWIASDRPEPFRSELRTVILKNYSSMPSSEFDHQLIAEYFDAPADVLQDRYRFLLLGKRRYAASKFRQRAS